MPRGDGLNKDPDVARERGKLGGRPKGALSLTTILKTMLENDLVEYKDARGKVYKINKAQALNLKLLEKALKGDGDLSAMREIFNRAEGLPKQPLEHSGGIKTTGEITIGYKEPDTEN